MKAKRAALIAAGVSLAGCAAQYNFKTREEVFDPANMARAETFAFAPEIQTRDGDAQEPAPLIPDPVAADVRAALSRELVARGLMPASGEAADIVVSYSVGSTTGASMITDAYLGSYSTFSADAAREMSYVDQALIVDLTSRPSGASIWRGQATARLYGPMGDARTEVINQAVARIIGQLDDDL